MINRIEMIDDYNFLKKSMLYMKSNYVFDGLNIDCYFYKDLNEQICANLSNHIINVESSQNENRNYEILLDINSKRFDKFMGVVSKVNPNRELKLFREFTGKQLHYEYEIDNVKLFIADHWSNAIVIKLSNSKIYLLLKNKEDINYDYPLYIIRELVLRTAQIEKKIMLHASGLEISGKSVAFIGGKGAGKTTALFKLSSSNFDTNVISNDRIIIENNANLYRMHYFPLIFRVGAGTAKKYPAVKETLFKKYSTFNLEKAGRLQNTTDISSKYSLTKYEFENIFKTKMKAQGSFDAIIFPEIIIGSDEIKVKMAEKDTAYRNLIMNCLSLNEDLFIDPWLVSFDEYTSLSEKEIKQKLEDIVDTLPLYELEYGSDCTPDNFAGFINQLIFHLNNYNEKDNKYN